jgi:hypothetical protein
VTKLRLILTVLMMSFMLVGTTSAAINPLTLNNNNPLESVTLGHVDNPNFDLIKKYGLGTDIVPISLTNMGDTLISAGVLQFNGRVTDLHTVVGSSSASLGVGNGTYSSNLTANSICTGTLTIAAGSTITIRPIPGGVVTTPEPISWVIWLLFGLIAVMAYRHHR